MRRKTVILTLSLLILSGLAVASDYTHNTELYFGESIEVNDYIIEYESKGYASGQVFRIGEWTDSSFHVIEEIEDSDIYEAEGERIRVSENMSLVVEQVGYSEDGKLIELSISASRDAFSSGKMTTTAPSKIIVSRDESASVPLTLENTGYLNQTYNLSAETNSSLQTSFSFQDFNVSSVYVAAGEEEDVDAEIEVPEDARIGTYDLKLVAENYTRFSENIKVEIKGAEKEREMDIDVEQIYKEVKPGENTEFYVSIRNRGEAKLEDINVTASPPNGWDYEIEDGFIEELRYRYGRERAKITVTAPQDANAGDYMMEVSAESAHATIEEPREVRLHVRKKSGLAYIGALLMVLSLGILVVVYRKFQRR